MDSHTLTLLYRQNQESEIVKKKTKNVKIIYIRDSDTV
jgi:hypothetical protein